MTLSEDQPATAIVVDIPLSTRLRVYGVVMALTFSSVLFLHRYMTVGLSMRELFVHAADITLGTAAWAAVCEAVGLAWQRSLYWQITGLPRVLGLIAVAILASAALEVMGPHEWLPQTAEIRARHVESGYGRDPVRGLVLGAVILVVGVQTAHRDQLRRERDALRAVNRALRERMHTVPPTSAPRLVLHRDGGDLAVAPESVMHVQAQENYCEFALAPDEGVAAPARAMVRMTLADALAKLPERLFVQTHRSHLANLDYVEELAREGRQCSLRLRGGAEVPVARGRRQAVRERLRKFAEGGGLA